jgi:hypothetical protein
MSVMAVGAKPLLLRLRDELEGRDRIDCMRRLNFAVDRSITAKHDRDHIDLAGEKWPCPDGSATINFQNGKKMPDEVDPKFPLRDDNAIRVNSILSLYERNIGVHPLELKADEAKRKYAANWNRLLFPERYGVEIPEHLFPREIFDAYVKQQLCAKIQKTQDCSPKLMGVDVEYFDFLFPKNPQRYRNSKALWKKLIKLDKAEDNNEWFSRAGYILGGEEEPRNLADLNSANAAFEHFSKPGVAERHSKLLFGRVDDGFVRLVRAVSNGFTDA